MKIKKMIEKCWKYVLGAVVAVAVTGMAIAYVTADDTLVPILTNNGESTYIIAGATQQAMTVQVTIPDFTGTEAELAALVQNNTVWETGNNQVAVFVDGSGAETTTYKGDVATVKAVSAGMTTIKVKFYYKYDADGKISNEVYTDGAAGFEVAEIDFASFICKLNTTFDPNVYDPNRVYTVGQTLGFTTNAYLDDPLAVETNNEVVSGGPDSGSYNRGIVTVVKGGKANVRVLTTSGHVLGSNSYVEGLYEDYTIVSACRFDVDEVLLTNDQFGINVPVPSNLDTSDQSGITYKSDNSEIATMDKSCVTAHGAGITTVYAGVLGSDGNYMVYSDPMGSVDSSDSITVEVPFAWLSGNKASATMTYNLNIGDNLQLSTNAISSAKVTYESLDPSYATVSDSGYVTTHASGSTTIKATVDNGDGFVQTIEATINIGDTFALNASDISIGAGESYDITAIGAQPGATITYTINGIDAASFNNGLTAVVNSNVITVKGVTTGSYTVKAQMEYNGIIKTATCMVHVKTQVTDVTISPEILNLNVGDTANLTVTVGPNAAYNKNVVWVSSDSDVVSIDTDNADAFGAIITAKKGGIATVTVVSVSDGTKYATCTVNVREAVTGITLSETNVTVNMNIIPEYVLIATVLPENTTGLADGVNRNVIWSSTDENVLTVDQNGKVTFVAPGTAAVVAKTEDGGHTAYCNFTVSVPVEEVRITSDDLILNVGDEVALTAEVLPLTASNRTVVWSTTDENVITIDSNGTLKAVNAGHAAVFCRSLDNGAEDYINVYVRQPVSTVTMNTNAITVPKGTEFWLYATILPEDADVKIVDWSTSDETLATVGPDGKVTALMPGVVTITATSRDTGDSDFCVVTIEEAVTSITLATGDSQTLFVGAQFTIVPEILPIDAPNKNVTYLSTNEEIATVDENGVVTAIRGGECDIIVTTEERQLKALCHITVKEYLSTITLDRDFTYINIGSYTDLIATVTTDTATNKNIVWKTANSAIATVDQTGRVTAVNYGTTVITAVAEDGGGATATCVVQVVEPVTSITLTDKEIHMIAGDTYIIGATILPPDATVKKLRWETTNPAVATVDEDGEVTAVAGGKCRIYAYSTDGNEVSAYCTVYVTNVTNATALTLNSSDITIKIGENRQLTVKSTPTQITEGLAWYSTDTGVVTVDQNGNIVGRAEGTANVVVYGKESGVEGICKVTVISDVVKANSVKINSTEITMLAGKTRQLVIRLNPTNSTENIRWYSTDTSVVVVDSNGKITTVGPGHAEVVAVTATTGIETSCLVHSMAISRSSVTLQQYDPFMLYVDGAPSNVSWRTNNPRIATVSSNGEVIGRKEGTTTITATVDGKTLTCTVTITEATKD